jgi:hypothetical protein
MASLLVFKVVFMIVQSWGSVIIPSARKRNGRLIVKKARKNVAGELVLNTMRGYLEKGGALLGS